MMRKILSLTLAAGLIAAPVAINPDKAKDAGYHALMVAYSLGVLFEQSIAEAGGHGKGKGCGPTHSPPSPPPRGGGGPPPDGGIYCKPDKWLQVIRVYEAYGCTWYVHVLRSNPKGQKYTFPFRAKRL